MGYRSWLQKMADEAISDHKTITFQFFAAQFIFGPEQVRYRELPSKKWLRDQAMERRAHAWARQAKRHNKPSQNARQRSPRLKTNH